MGKGMDIVIGDFPCDLMGLAPTTILGIYGDLWVITNKTWKSHTKSIG